MRGNEAVSKRKKFAVLFFILVLVPGFLFLFNSAKHVHRKLPYLGEHEVIAPGDTEYFTVPPFSFTDQDGHVITDRTVKDKVLVVDFFFTSCKSICPRMSKEMQQLQFRLDEKAYDDVLFLSHTVDPEHDTPQVLKEYARKLQVDTSRWKFLTGNADSIYRQGNLGYLLGAREDTANPERFVHSPQFVLVDKRRHIRGMYDGTVTRQVDSLVTDLKMLLAEERERAHAAAKE